jgi:thiol-disulfide isomerase/thioredoxin
MNDTMIMKLLSTVLCALLFVAVADASAQNLSTLSTLLSTPSGDQASVAKLGEGKVTIVSFWATWCKPCKEEMKAMQPLYDRLKEKGVQYVAVSIDNTKTMAKVGPYIASKGYTFPVLLDPNSELFRAVNGTEVPFTLVYNADGTLHAKHDGYFDGDETKLEKEITDLVEKGSASGTSH